MIKELLAKVSAKQDLTFEESRQAIDEIMSGEVSDAVISSFLTAPECVQRQHSLISAGTHLI